MSPVLNSIKYRFTPDPSTQKFCEKIANEINGNGAALSDISAEGIVIADVTVTTLFNWSIQVSLKHKSLEVKAGKNVIFHNSATEAQHVAKKQAQLIISDSSAKIELINNINEDPSHYYRHGVIKLSGGKTHAFNEACRSHCHKGQLTCPRCHGKGTKKATTKKEDLLGTIDNFDANNICSECKGRGSVDCHTCSGSGVISHIYEVHVDATRQHKNMINTKDVVIKEKITHFISQHSHSDLIKQYLSPVVINLQDIDQTHFNVAYQSKTQYAQIKISVLDKTYQMLGFGDQCNCIEKPKVLDDILLPAVSTVIGTRPQKNSAAKLLKLQSLRILKPLLNAINDKSNAELAALLYNDSNQLLSKEAAQLVIQQIVSLKTALVPRYSLSAWFPFVVSGVVSALYFGLATTSTAEMLTSLSLLLAAVLIPGYLISKNLTSKHRDKLKLKTAMQTLERAPALFAAALVIACFMLPRILTTDQRWHYYFTLHQYASVLTKPALSENEIISNTGLIVLAEKYLQTLDYKNITIDGIYDTETEFAVKDLQQKFGLPATSYLDTRTMKLLTKYVIIKQAKFSDRKVTVKQ